jgi:hypothetical protein
MNNYFIRSSIQRSLENAALWSVLNILSQIRVALPNGLVLLVLPYEMFLEFAMYVNTYCLPLPFNLYLITLTEFDEECTLRCSSYFPPVDPFSSVENTAIHLFLKHLEICVFSFKLDKYAK